MVFADLLRPAVAYWLATQQTKFSAQLILVASVATGRNLLIMQIACGIKP